MNVRIPAAQFDSVMSEIKAIAGDVLSQSITSDDESKEYYDLTSRLKSKRAELDQLNLLYKSAKSVKDIIAVRDETVKVQEEIDELGGGAKKIEEEVRMSQLSIEIVSVGSDGFGKKISGAFSDGWTSLEDFIPDLIRFVIMASPFIVVLVLIIMAWRMRKRRIRKRMAEQGATTA